MRVAVRVRPRSSRPSVGGSYDGALVVRVAAAPVDGRANEAVRRAVAQAFAVAPGAVTLVTGTRSATKLLEVYGDEAPLRRRLAELLALP